MMVHEETAGDFDLENWSYMDDDGTVLVTSVCGPYTMIGGYGVLSD
jgi:hypothetical protein